MPETMDLEENAEEFLQYTADKSYGDLIALEGHLDSILKGERVRFCLACCLKHEISLSKLGEECLVGLCPNQPLWIDIAKWATKNKEKHLRLIRENEHLTDDEALKLAQGSRNFRKQMEGIMIGENVPKKRGLEPPDFEEVAGVDNPGKTEEMKQITKKRRSLWPWLILVVGAGTLYYFHGKKKTTEAPALARAKQAELGVQTQPTGEKTKPGGNHPGLKIRGQEGEISPNNRLRAILEEE